MSSTSSPSTATGAKATTSPTTTPTAQPAAATQTDTPRVVITFCTQCKWLLRAAYYAQELLSTFGTGIGEVALRPGTGGVFLVDVVVVRSVASGSGPGPVVSGHTSEVTSESASGEPGANAVSTMDGESGADVREKGESSHYTTVRIWDRKIEGGFPETKVLKRLLRDLIDPRRDLGHVDRHDGPAVGSVVDPDKGKGEGESEKSGKSEVTPETAEGEQISEVITSNDAESRPGQSNAMSVAEAVVTGAEIPDRTVKENCEDCV